MNQDQEIGSTLLSSTYDTSSTSHDQSINEPRRLSPHILGTFDMVLYLAHVDCSVVSQHMLWLMNRFFLSMLKVREDS